MATLIIAEKAKAAKAIAEALGPSKSIKKSKYLYIYHIPSKDIYVIPLRGHILEYKNTAAYKSWTKSNPRDIITDPKAIKKFSISYAGPYIKALKEYSKMCNRCIIATDADIEGCTIGLFDALPFVRKVKPNITVSQMWLSSLQKKEILNKFNNTIAPKFSWGETGEARAIIDAIIGFSATREITNTLKPLLEKYNIKFTSIGRVQTSLLYLIYLRDERVNNFTPELYFTIEASLVHQNGLIKALHQSNPFKKEAEVKVKKIYEKIKNEKIAQILNKSDNSVKKKPPTPLNTSKALILLTKTLKISASQAFNTMNALYLNKIISYPRTDSDVYASNFDHLQYLQKFTSNSQYGKYTSNLLKGKSIQPTRGKKDAGDHPPITPIESLEQSSKKFDNDLQKKVYDLLARHYLALFGKDATELKNVLKLSIKEEPFTARRVSLISEGFFEIAPFLKVHYDSEIKIVGNTIPIREVSFNSKKTKPPPRYTDTTLLKLMEKNNLGTKATRPVIILLLQKRTLIYRNKRQYGTTELGHFIIENLKGVWLPFLKPSFTREIEEQLEDIKNSKKKMDEVVESVKNKFLALFDKFLKNKATTVSKIDEFKEENKEMFQSVNDSKSFPLTTSMCPICNKQPMKLIKTYKNKRFLACSDRDCKSYLSVPKTGSITILKSTCSICTFNIFKIRKQKNNRSFNYYICPNCWTKGLKEKTSNGFCSNCDDYEVKNGKCLKK